jgi:hypothetical protein
MLWGGGLAVLCLTCGRDGVLRTGQEGKGARVGERRATYVGGGFSGVFGSDIVMPVFCLGAWCLVAFVMVVVLACSAPANEC